MDNTLFDTTLRFNGVTKRNVVAISDPRVAFATLIDHNDEVNIITQATTFARDSLSRHHEDSDFYYTTAIGYPFQTKPFMQTRYSDGTFPVWYASQTVETTIYETAYHDLQFALADNSASHTETIIRKRHVFDVTCTAILIDLTQKSQTHPNLVAENYHLTQQIGKTIQSEGLAGLRAPSARDQNGINFAIFKPTALTHPTLSAELCYTLHPKTKTVVVSGLKKPMTLVL